MVVRILTVYPCLPHPNVQEAQRVLESVQAMQPRISAAAAGGSGGSGTPGAETTLLEVSCGALVTAAHASCVL